MISYINSGGPQGVLDSSLGLKDAEKGKINTITQHNNNNNTNKPPSGENGLSVC